MENKYILIILIIFIEFGREIILKKNKKCNNFYNPTNILRRYWLINLGLGIIFSYKINISIQGLKLILYFIYLFDIFYLLETFLNQMHGSKEKNEINEIELYKVLKILSIISIFIFFILLKKLNIKISDFFDWSVLHNKILILTNQRYKGEINLGGKIQLLIGILYSNILLLGIYSSISYRKIKDIVILNLSIYVTSIYGFLINTKATLIYISMFYFSGYCFGKVYKKEKIKNKTIIILIFIVLTILLIMIFMMKIRSGKFDNNKLYIYFLGHVSASTNWINENIYTNNLQYNYIGKFTFLGPYNLLGIFKRESGVFTGFIKIGKGMETNVYSIWRNLLEDFGIFGLSLVMMISGYIFSKIYRDINESVAYQVLYMMFISTVILSSITSIFVYNSIILAFIYLYIYLRIIEK